MSFDLLHYYERELGWLKQASTDFATAHPAIAGNLGLRDDIVDDPHVSRLLEGVAFMNARIQQSLDDDFPQISDALLEHLYPQYLAPTPAMTIVEMVANDDDQSHIIEAGSIIDTPPVDGVRCQFRTIYPVTLLPLQLSDAKMLAQPLDTPGATTNAVAVLALKLQARSNDFNFDSHGTDKLRLFLRGTQNTWLLYDLLVSHCVNVVVSCDASPTLNATLAPACLRMVGFAPDEAMVPASRPTPHAGHLLQEFLHFPQKFLFVDLHGLAAATKDMRGDLSIYIYLDASNRELERHIDADCFSLTATPVVNLFRHWAEPLSLAAGRFEYPLVADARNADSYEVHAVTQVTHIDEISGERSPVLPFFGHTYGSLDACWFWHHRRELSLRTGSNGESGFDSFIAFSDIDCQTMTSQRAIVQVELLCSNRNLPARINTTNMLLRLRNDGGRLRQIRPLLPLTAPLRRRNGNSARWRLLAHLNSSLCGLSGGSDATGTLRDILNLHAADDTVNTRAQIAAIDNVQVDTAMLPVRHSGRIAFCHGIDVCITFNESRLAGSSPTLYAAVLEQFLAQSVSINTFVRIVVKRKGQPDALRHGRPRLGAQTLL